MEDASPGGKGKAGGEQEPSQSAGSVQGNVASGDEPPWLVLAVLVRLDALVRHAELKEVQPHPEPPEREQ